MKYLLKNEEIALCNESEKLDFPKYTSQLINLANQNAQGTRPAVVGQMSELFSQFAASGETMTIRNWEKWYTDKYPDAIDNAADKIFSQLQNLKDAISQIDREMIVRWVTDLVIDKTFNGMHVQKSILASLAKKRNLPFRLSNPSEESAGIDGYVGDTAYSIKPNTYKTMTRLPEAIDVKMIYYEKAKSGLKIEVED